MCIHFSNSSVQLRTHLPVPIVFLLATVNKQAVPKNEMLCNLKLLSGSHTCAYLAYNNLNNSS